MKWPSYYILVGRVPFAVDLETWGRWFETTSNRIVATTVVDDTPTEKTKGFPGRERKYIGPKVRVSTIFLGLDHNYSGGEPILFETMIFGGPLDGEQWRYHTYDEAERGHANAVKDAKIAQAKVKAIADMAGAKEK